MQASASLQWVLGTKIQEMVERRLHGMVVGVEDTEL